MNKEIFKQSKFYIAIVSFLVALFYISQEGLVAMLGSFFWFLTFIVSLYKANKKTKKSTWKSFFKMRSMCFFFRKGRRKLLPSKMFFLYARAFP